MFTGKVVIVTGCCSGIGKATCLKFASMGANVVAVGKTQDERMQNLIEEMTKVKKENSQVLCFAYDLSDVKNVNRIVDFTMKKFGKIDILVNNAGITPNRDSFSQIEYDEVLNLFNINLLSPMFLSKLIAPIMYENKYGKIINISSTSGYTDTCPSSADYNISKIGLQSLTRDLAREYAPYVNVNAIAPGWVKTPMIKNLTEEYINKEVQKIYMKRFALPEEIANTIIMFASDDTRYVTGQVLLVDGGHWQ